MSLLAVELNDAGLVAVHESRPEVEVVPPSPGFALLLGNQMLTGVAAFRRFRLEPKKTASRFWDTLDTTPLPRPFPRHLTHADLVHAHLEGFWRGVQSEVENVILSVPAWYTDEQLGLILGIARSCGMPVHGMIDSSLAASSLVRSGEKRVYMDIHLHRTGASFIEGGDELHRGRVEVHPRLGLMALWDAWIKLVAELFVRKTRFDPLHLAETEQGLYLSLPQWLERLREQEVTRLVLAAGGKDYSIELHRDEVIERARSHYEEINRLALSVKGSDDNVTFALSHRLSRLPGLVHRLSANPGVDLRTLPPAAAATGALRAKDVVLNVESKDELTFVTRLGLAAQVERQPSVGASSQGTRPTPTHVLFDGIAERIGSEPYVIGGSRCLIRRQEGCVIVEDAGDSRTFVNGQAIEGRSTLYAGDRVRVGSSGREVQLIEVKD